MNNGHIIILQRLKWLKKLYPDGRFEQLPSGICKNDKPGLHFSHHVNSNEATGPTSKDKFVGGTTVPLLTNLKMVNKEA